MICRVSASPGVLHALTLPKPSGRSWMTNHSPQLRAGGFGDGIRAAVMAVYFTRSFPLAIDEISQGLMGLAGRRAPGSAGSVPSGKRNPMRVVIECTDR